MLKWPKKGPAYFSWVWPGMPMHAQSAGKRNFQYLGNGLSYCPGIEIRAGNRKFPAEISFFPATKSFKNLKFPVLYSAVSIDIST